MKSYFVYLGAQTKQSDHKQFYEHLYALMNGEIQEDDYEKSLHKLLGPQCYNLITLKILLKSVERQLINCFTADKSNTQKQIRMFEEFNERAQSLKNPKNPHVRSSFVRMYYQKFISHFGSKDVIFVQFTNDNKNLVLRAVEPSIQEEKAPISIKRTRINSNSTYSN
jgi:histone deacetylase complex regulatory component SIN3